MISFGNNIQSASDELSKIPVRQLYDMVRNPSPSVSARLRQLRIVRQFNPSQYAAVKRQLPYVVCAMFNPPHRRTENFAYAEYFIIDIDHLSEKEIDLASLRTRLAADSRVCLCFASPGGDGLKVLMRLSERCYDAGLYKVFYRLFATRFSSQYGLQQVIDTRTCDVARACFVSEDANAFFNPQPVPVNMKEYVDAETDIAQALDLKRTVEKQEKEQAASQPLEKEKRSPDAEALALIRSTLNPQSRLSRAKAPAYVPQELEGIMERLLAHVAEKGVTVTEVRSISYGKKLRFKLGVKQAEINIFYGKRGFSVVQSPRTGTDGEMNALMADVVEAYIAEKV